MKLLKNKIVAATGAGFLATFPLIANARGEGLGGLEESTTSLLTTVRTVIIAVVGIVATIALTWQLAQGFMGRKTWGDIFESCLWILGAGAGVALATWIFTRGQSLTFSGG
ncbi:MAG: hypothetical protein DI620_03720 [Haemophilus parainfluenzae]|jgi:tagB2|nr:MAG: hypothetical protein DI620_03720 [Haemophilus parainfluenzae]